MPNAIQTLPDEDLIAVIEYEAADTNFDHNGSYGARSVCIVCCDL